MTSNTSRGGRILGSLRVADGTGIVRIEDRFETGIAVLWSALTDPLRLARWLGEVEGDLRPGGEFRARFLASGWEGTGRVEVCEAPHRLLVWTGEADEPDERATEATLTADGDQTILVIEEHVPAALLAEYGAGNQVHVEDLAAHIGGGERCDARARWDELISGYRDLAATARQH